MEQVNPWASTEVGSYEAKEFVTAFGVPAYVAGKNALPNSDGGTVQTSGVRAVCPALPRSFLIIKQQQGVASMQLLMQANAQLKRVKDEIKLGVKQVLHRLATA